MPIAPPEPVAHYIEASNTHDADAIAACFHEDAEVRDEGGVMRGKSAIQAWARRTIDEYGFRFKPMTIDTEDEAVTLINEVSGSFDGSPVRLTFRFTLAGNAIASLAIT